MGPVDLGNTDRDAATSDHTKIRSIETIDTDNGFATDITVHLADVIELDVHNSDLGGVATSTMC